MGVMKVAGWVGVIFTILSLIGLTLSIVAYFNADDSTIAESSADESETSGTAMTILILGLAIIFLIMIILFWVGFIKMGRFTESKIIIFSAWSFIVSLIALIILGIIDIYLLIDVMDSFSNSLFLPNDPEYGASSTLLKITAGLTLFNIIYTIIVSFIFSVGLIKIRNKVSFTLPSGIFGFITTTAYTILLSIFSYLSFKIYSAVSSKDVEALSNLAPMIVNLSFFARISQTIIPISGFFLLLFLTLALFNASKKFESKDGNQIYNENPADAHPVQQQYNQENYGMQPTNIQQPNYPSLESAY